MRSQLFVTLSALAASVLANPVPDNYVEHEALEFLHPAWTKLSGASPAGLVPVRIGITQDGHHERLEELLMEVSSHDSPNYGKHYTQEQIHDLFAPSDDVVSAIRAWLEKAGIAKDRVTQSFNRQWLQFDSEIHELEDLLKAKYHVYEHSAGHKHVACEKYHVPADIAHHIDYITPGIKMMIAGDGRPPTKHELAKRMEKRAAEKEHLPIIKSPYVWGPEPDESMREIQMKEKSDSTSLCSAVITPACLKAMYNITKATVTPSGLPLGIFEDLNDHYSQQDLNLYFQAIATNIPVGTHPVLKGVDGAIGPVPVSQSGAESGLDFQLSYPVIYPANSVLFQTDDQPTEEDYEYSGFLNNFFDAIDGSYCGFNPFNQTLPPKEDPHYPDPKKGGYKGKLQCGKYTPTPVISISYGGAEFGFSTRYQRRQCMEIGKLGMRGITVVVSSGDDGVATFPGFPTPNGCINKDLKFHSNPAKNGTIFTPDFPGTCPFITALGSTFLPAGADPHADAEIATTRFPSGGGFSNIYLQPSYQKAAVQSYLTKYPPKYPSYQVKLNNNIGRDGGIYNSQGRGYPDFAAVGDNVLIYNLGRPRTIGGTSASAPFFSSLIARINMERAAAGKSTVGFVNPVLYAHPEVFNDITVGNNPGCNTTGFDAQPGWDPVTGLGTPNYAKMLKLFLSLK